MCHFWNYFTFLSFAYFFSSNFVHTPFVSFFQGSFLPTYYFSKKRLQRNWGNVFVLVLLLGYKEGTIQSSFQLLCLIDSFVIMIWFRWEFSLKENTEAGFKWSKAEFLVQRNLLLVRAAFWGKRLSQNKLKYESYYFVRERYLSAACTLDIINDVSQDTLFRVLR